MQLKFYEVLKCVFRVMNRFRVDVGEDCLDMLSTEEKVMFFLYACIKCFLVDKCKLAFIASKFCCLQPLLKFFLIICSSETTSDENLKMHIQILLIRGEAKQVLSTSMFYMLASQRAVICNWGSQRTKNKHCSHLLFLIFLKYIM